MKKEIDDGKILNAIKSLVFNSRVNNYAAERVAFGYEKTGDKAPIDLYLKHLRLDITDAPNRYEDIYGVYIDEQGCISAEQDYTEYVHDLFVYQMERIFFYAPKDIQLERDGEEIPLYPRFRKYLFGVLPLFAEILNVKVEYNAFDVMPINNEARMTEYPKWIKFVTAILINPLRSGSQINRYVKDFTCAPHYIRRLIEKKGKNFYLKPVDIESCEYIFALFSLMIFMNAENDRMFEMKMREWERIHS